MQYIYSSNNKYLQTPPTCLCMSFASCQSLEKHLLSLQGRLEDFEQIQHQLEEDEDPGDLENARDSVRRHVETKQQLEKLDLDIACEAVSHTIGKLLPCDNPDFVGE